MIVQERSMYETIYEIEKFTLPEDSIIFAIGIIILCVFTSDILIDIIEAMKKIIYCCLKE